LGHELGLDDNLDPLDVMDVVLSPGERRLPAAADVAPASAPTNAGSTVLPQPGAGQASLAPGRHTPAGTLAFTLSAADLGLFFASVGEDTFIHGFDSNGSNGRWWASRINRGATAAF
jgi:hypothetical protein